MLALAATGLAQTTTVPAGYKKVYLTSMVDKKFAIVPKAAKNGSTTVVQTLANTAAQQWILKDGNTTIMLAGTTLCLDGGAKSKLSQLSKICFRWEVFGFNANSMIR